MKLGIVLIVIGVALGTERIMMLVKALDAGDIGMAIMACITLVPFFVLPITWGVIRLQRAWEEG